MIPEEWKHKVSKNTSKQYRILKSLMDRDDISEVIEACDAGREGELISRLVYIIKRGVISPLKGSGYHQWKIAP